MRTSLIIFAFIYMSIFTLGCRSTKKDVIPEMKDFMSNYFGSYHKIKNGIKKYAIPNIDAEDMNVYDLSQPEILSSKQVNKRNCYVIKAKAGLTEKNYETCWLKGKIVTISYIGTK